MQRFAQIGLSVVEPQLDGLERGVRQALIGYFRRRGTVLAATSAMMTALSMASFRRRLR